MTRFSRKNSNRTSLDSNRTSKRSKDKDVIGARFGKDLNGTRLSGHDATETGHD